MQHEIRLGYILSLTASQFQQVEQYYNDINVNYLLCALPCAIDDE